MRKNIRGNSTVSRARRVSKADRWQVYDALPAPIRAALQEGPNALGTLWARGILRRCRRIWGNDTDALDYALLFIRVAHNRSIAEAVPWQPNGYRRRKPLPSPHIMAKATMQTSGRTAP